MFFNDPPGQIEIETLRNYGERVSDVNYIAFHDQEPIYLDVHRHLFDEIARRNLDIAIRSSFKNRAVITSEYRSKTVQQLEQRYGWNSYYYFFHGWAALDWFRGYDKTFLITPIEQRSLKHSFINPNRIIGGRRDHRVLLFYWLRKLGVVNDLTSFPKICPAELMDVNDIAVKYSCLYPDIDDVINQVVLPWNMPGESDHPMHSCWLSLFKECGDSLAYVVSETVCYGERLHLTEKTFKPICMQMPFVLMSCAGSLDYLKSYGFKTFNHVWNEDYDCESDDLLRIEKIGRLLKDIDSLGVRERKQVLEHCKANIEHNYHHFYSGGFEKILWTEFTAMLTQIQRDFKC